MTIDLKKYEGASSHPLARDDKQRAYQHLVNDAPKLLAEVVKLRESVTELAAALGAIIDGDATYSGDIVSFLMYPRHTDNMQAIADARAVLAKHGGTS